MTLQWKNHHTKNEIQAPLHYLQHPLSLGPSQLSGLIWGYSPSLSPCTGFSYTSVSSQVLLLLGLCTYCFFWKFPLHSSPQLLLIPMYSSDASSHSVVVEHIQVKRDPEMHAGLKQSSWPNQPFHEFSLPHWDDPYWERADCFQARRGGCTEENYIPGESEETQIYGLEINSTKNKCK